MTCKNCIHFEDRNIEFYYPKTYGFCKLHYIYKDEEDNCDNFRFKGTGK
jgi:hypothetical protein